jgi:AcrR family transcriptional regulator
VSTVPNVVPLESERTRVRIIEAAEELLRRYGPGKTKVVDVAHHLGMSHASVYRYFESKAAILDIVVARWLTGISGPLEEYVAGESPPTERLRDFIFALFDLKHRKFHEDPDLFATYHLVASGSPAVLDPYRTRIRAIIAAIILEGAERGEFTVREPAIAAKAVHEALSRFIHPYFVTRADREKEREGLKLVVDLAIAGLKRGVL